MSLDARMERIAREEVARTLGEGPDPDKGAPTRTQLQQQITDLHEHLHQAATTISRLEARVDVLEKATAGGQGEAPLPRRTTARKRTDA